MELIIKFASSGVFSYLIIWPLFNTDPLATGKSKYSLFFRGAYPSLAIKNKYVNSNDGDVKNLWFDYFNKWSDPKNKHNLQWVTVLDRTYACRFIYYFTMLICYALICSAIAILAFGVYHWYQGTPLFNFKQVFYFAIILLVFIFLKMNNRIPSSEKGIPTGAWYKYKEISDIEISTLNQEILDNAPTYKQAQELVNNYA